MFVAPKCNGPLVLLSALRDGVEYVLDARALSRLRTPMARDPVLSLPADVAARKLVSLSGRARRVERRYGGRTRRARDDVDANQETPIVSSIIPRRVLA